MKIFFARHAESQANLLHEVSNHGLKHPLTLTGRAQAAELARRLQPYAITHIYSSPILRAIETCIIVANQLGIPYEVCHALREYDVGILEGRSDPEAWQIWQDLFDNWTLRQRWEDKIEGGESFYDVKNRFGFWLESLVHAHQDTDANILCIAHGGLYRLMLPWLIKNIDSEFIESHQGFPYTVLIVTQLVGSDLVCIEWNGSVISS